ncbi:diguanylate cyclase [Pseudomonas sp. zfem002]|uniref:diguanylate cyclase n=1 Tax=Pseudomonas sp. zfem002 TaxID=3078197 RepID=UPI0029298379|nr:diguanylate cyclase [Pseudomonas sp. zfem002]MDU9392032.1 diguanylate cyclase [Pseudomonas sp. zfem002]
MPSVSPELQAREWHSLVAQFPRALTRALQSLVESHKATLAARFYEHMLADPNASLILSHDEVKSRLGSSMQAWLVKVYSASAEDDFLPLVALQKQVGEVHARIDVPLHLVLSGARHLKKQLFQLIVEQGWAAEEHAQILRLSSETMDLAMEIMSHAYSRSHDRNSRNEEGYRLFSVLQNITTERERQRGALLDWENSLMFDLAMGSSGVNLPRLATSDFGLWFRHKGAYAFQNTPQSEQILGIVRNMDDELLPQFLAAGEELRMALLREIRDQTKSLMFNLDSLFNTANELESGRDVLTRMLNRKFLPVVIGNEITIAQKSAQGFSVLAVDIDRFKYINDTFGHDAGDLILQQTAEILSSHSRAGDYVFRMGGEEFLMILVDINHANALKVAEKLRRQVEAEPLNLTEGRRHPVTVSIGVATYNGHPDYQHLLRQADQAMYQAKQGGRNRVVSYEAVAG